MSTDAAEVSVEGVGDGDGLSEVNGGGRAAGAYAIVAAYFTRISRYLTCITVRTEPSCARELSCEANRVAAAGSPMNGQWGSELS